LTFDTSGTPYLRRILEKVYSGKARISRVVRGSFDHNWHKEWDHFYRKQWSPPWATRLRLRCGDRFLGFCHIRPASDASKVSETYLAPPPEQTEENGYYWKCLVQAREYDEEPIDCVPFIMPEGNFGMCIHGSIWIVLKNLEIQSNGVVECPTIPEIQQLASGRRYADWEGLAFTEASRILRMSGCNCFYYNSIAMMVDPEQMVNILYAYIESRLPVIIGASVAKLPWWEPGETGYHSLVAIGHTMSGGKVDGFLFHDQSLLPYQKMKIDELRSAWVVPNQEGLKEAVVAIYPSVELRYEVALRDCINHMARFADQDWLDLELYDIEAARPLLDYPFHAEIKEKRWFLVLINDVAERTRSRVPMLCWMFHFYPEPAGRLEGRISGVYLRDATRRTDFRLAYLPAENKAILRFRGRFYEYTLKRTGRLRRRRLQD